MSHYYKRLITLPKKSFFLLGPRGTGKTTCLKEHAFDIKINLLSSQDYLAYKAQPHLLQARTKHLSAGSWVLIDEIQKVPALLDEVHLLYEEQKLHFALSGSRARKLKRQGANLLAGRALNLEIFPLCYGEYGEDLDLTFRLHWGTLPIIVDNRDTVEETMMSYVHTYLRQEIAEEGLVRKLEAFTRFLQVAALYNGKMLNYQSISENSYATRPAVRQYFEILFDTLLAYKLPAWRPRLKVREVKTSKFYFFDPGIARACLGFQNEVDNAYFGYSLENLIINEIRAYNSYMKKKADLYYYAISDSFEIDLLIHLGTAHGKERLIALEIKLAERWDPRWSAGLHLFANDERLDVKRKIGIYTGQERLTLDDVEIMPVNVFLKELFEGKVF